MEDAYIADEENKILYQILSSLQFTERSEDVTMKPFIIPGYEIFDTAEGDLNNDGLVDKILVLSFSNNNEEIGVEYAGDYPFLILLGSKEGKLTLAGRNDNLVLCSGCGGMFPDPYEGTFIGKGLFTVSHYGGSAWRWYTEHTFTYFPGKNNWYLTEAVLGSFHSIDGNEQETKKTQGDFGWISFEEFNIEESEY